MYTSATLFLSVSCCFELFSQFVCVPQLRNWMKKCLCWLFQAPNDDGNEKRNTVNLTTWLPCYCYNEPTHAHLFHGDEYFQPNRAILHKILQTIEAVTCLVFNLMMLFMKRYETMKWSWAHWRGRKRNDQHGLYKGTEPCYLTWMAIINLMCVKEIWTKFENGQWRNAMKWS